ncbi:unnamed protein product, partial [Didymodactylos carnosus]
FFSYERIEEISNYLRKKIAAAPEVAIICGSGLGGLAELITDKISFPYNEIPYFPSSTVPGHRGNLIFGILNGIYVVCMQGRFHPYEGYTTALCAMPVRVMKMLGAHSLIVTCAAGAINKDYNIGDMMIIKDHLNFSNFAGPRFPPVGHAYDREYVTLMKQVAIKHGHELREGIYSGLGGPCYETIAEIRALRILGGDAVGMSVVHEVTVGAHCGFRILGLALLTNKCLTEYNAAHESLHEEVIRISELKANDMQQLILNFVGVLKENYV